MNTVFLVAASLALVTFVVHVFVGGVRVVRPLLAATEITGASRWLNYYCWHSMSLLILVMSGAFTYSAVNPDGRPMAILFTGLAGALSALSAGVALHGGIMPLRLPPTSLLATIAVAGTIGLLQ